MNYSSFKKNFYIEHDDLKNKSENEINQLKKILNIKVFLLFFIIIIDFWF